MTSRQLNREFHQLSLIRFNFLGWRRHTVKLLTADWHTVCLWTTPLWAAVAMGCHWNVSSVYCMCACCRYWAKENGSSCRLISQDFGQDFSFLAHSLRWPFLHSYTMPFFSLSLSFTYRYLLFPILFPISDSLSISPLLCLPLCFPRSASAESAIRIQHCDRSGKESRDDASQRAEVGSFYSALDMLEIKKQENRGRGMERECRVLQDMCCMLTMYFWISAHQEDTRITSVFTQTSNILKFSCSRIVLFCDPWPQIWQIKQHCNV